MARPVTLYTLQWGDLSLETVCQKAKEFGYDGVELGLPDHVDVRRTGIMSGDTRHISIGSTDDLRRTIRPTHNHRIRFFLTPFQPTFLSIHTNIQAILYTYGDLTSGQYPFRASLITDQCRPIIIQKTIRHEGIQFTA